MTQTPKVTIRVLGMKGAFTLYNRRALQFRTWWENPPSKDALGKDNKVEFYVAPIDQRGHTFALLPIGDKGGYKRSDLLISYH